MVKIKLEGDLPVIMKGIKPEMNLAIMICDGIYGGFGFSTMVITSISDSLSSHKPTSRHRIGYAIDLRTRDMNSTEKSAIAKEIRESLGDEFYLLNEKTHFHIEYRG